MMAVTDVFWNGYCRSDFGHSQHIPDEIGMNIIRYCDLYVMRVRYRMWKGKEQAPNAEGWKTSILRFNQDVSLRSLEMYLDQNQNYEFPSSNIQNSAQRNISKRDAEAWSSGKRIDFLVIRAI